MEYAKHQKKAKKRRTRRKTQNPTINLIVQRIGLAICWTMLLYMLLFDIDFWICLNANEARKKVLSKSKIKSHFIVLLISTHTWPGWTISYQFAFPNIQCSKRNVTIICVIAQKKMNRIMTPTQTNSKHVMKWSLKNPLTTFIIKLIRFAIAIESCACMPIWEACCVCVTHAKQSMIALSRDRYLMGSWSAHG